MADITRILAAVNRGEAGARSQLAASVYDELRGLASERMRGERSDHTLEPTALANELYLRLLGGAAPVFESRAHLFGAAASAIRRLLVEHARARARIKRGGEFARVELDVDSEPELARSDEQLLALEAALERLAAVDARKARLVELRFFAGCSVAEAAQALDVSESTLAREWRVTRAWLRGQLEERLADGPPDGR
jgi:RNA polymerase sigma factor (TIGR02999 family)